MRQKCAVPEPVLQVVFLPGVLVRFFHPGLKLPADVSNKRAGLCHPYLLCCSSEAPAVPVNIEVQQGMVFLSRQAKAAMRQWKP